MEGTGSPAGKSRRSAIGMRRRGEQVRFHVGRVCLLGVRYFVLPVLDPAERHQVRVRQRCGAWRYRELMGSALVMPRARQRVFQRRLRRCARRARVADLLELLDYGWRERLVAGWLIAAGRRAELRARISRDLSDYLTMSLALTGEDDRQWQRIRPVRRLARVAFPQPAHRSDDAHRLAQRHGVPVPPHMNRT